MERQVISHSPAHTRRIAALIGQRARPHLIIALTGDLGSGKTCFVQGLARGLQVAEDIYVTSPSYTLIHSYPGRLILHHVDLYRLSGQDVEDIGLLDLMDEPGVMAIEWSQGLADDLPEAHLAVDIRILGTSARMLDIAAYGLAPEILLKGLPNVL
ncbi:MAG: tRNA (adenosine(37)-N6)-threonylcarbamoyltransferase complex ATPase subunit type 1 TsaE [Desulfobacterales bacterium]|jgi:tRNA threonylcarbamoyladenosine biosynthesis protein TsaE